MRCLFKNAFVYDTDTRSFFRGSVLFNNDVISQVFHSTSNLPNAEIVKDCGYRYYMIPGFVDVHTHGRCGFDFNTANDEQIKTMAISYALDGTTSIMPTLASASFDSLCKQADIIKSLSSMKIGAVIQGIHLEGRYLNPSRRGAHDPKLLKRPDPVELREFINHSGIPLHITAALEMDEGLEFSKTAVLAGATLGLGHTDAGYKKACELLKDFNISFTHLYNCMPVLHHRDGGPVLCGLTVGGFCELICDGFHISEEVVRFTYNCIGYERLCLISDSMSATASPDGEYSIAGSKAIVKDGIARTVEGNLAGSTLTLKTALENLSAFTGESLEKLIPCATVNPASECKIDNITGSIKPGLSADILLCYPFDGGKINIQSVYIRGKEVKNDD